MAARAALTAAFAVLLVIGLVLAWRGSRPSATARAHDILDQRLARGDLSAEEHAQRSSVLGKRPAAKTPGRPRGAIALVAVGLAGLLLTAAVGTNPADRRYHSNGERIYRSSTSESGDPISYQTGSRVAAMHRLACATCHRRDGNGGRVAIMPFGTIDVPDITWPELTEFHHDDEEPPHPPYREETLKQAITRGFNPAGKPLDPLMPRWRMSDRDLDDLIDYLKTLGVDRDDQS